MQTEKPKLAPFQIWNMCFGFLGIQIGFDLQNGNVSRIFQTLGAEIDALPILWIAAPLTGLIVQPIIGHFSDRTWGRLGRRRPYFLVGALLASAALVVMPNAPALWVAAGALWIMDAALNITMEPTRALVGDSLRDDQRVTGYAMQSFFIGLGAVLAGMLPWALARAGVANTAAPGVIPPTVHIAFYVGAATLLGAIVWTIVSTREYRPDQLDAFESARRGAFGAPAIDAEPQQRPANAFYAGGSVWLLAGAMAALFVWSARLDPRPQALAFLGDAEFRQDLYVLAGLIASFGVIQLVAGAMRAQGRDRNSFMEVVGDLFRMPPTMRQLAVVQFFTWFGLFAMWIYGAPALAAHHFHASDPASAAYQDAGNWWGVLGSVRNGVAAVSALAIMGLAATVDRRVLHAACLLLGSAGFVGMMLIPDPQLLWLPMAGVGLAWASVVSTPYAILAGSIPARKMGVYMGIFNIFIVVPQLVAATLLGFLLRTFFHNQPVWAFAIAATSFALAAAAILMLREHDNAPATRAPEA
ncbi:MAG: MFS transporter [Hyphomonadaceae bacterium]|nr:MFS transporter [Hyphomonadaceae bacterium]